MAILILSYALFYTTLAWLRLDWAIAVLVVALPSYLIRFNILGLPFTLLEVMILIVFFVWFSQNWHEQISKIKLAFSSHKKLKKLNYPYDKEIALLLIIVFISLVFAGFSNNALGSFKAYFFEPILLYIVIFNVFFKEESTILIRPKIKASLNFLLNSLAASAFLVSCFAIFQKITNVGLPFEWIKPGRITSFFEYPNAVGLYLGPIILIMVSMFVVQLGILRVKNKIQVLRIIFIFITIILSLISIYFAGSEGALIGVGTSLILFGFFVNKQLKYIIISLIIIFFIGILVNPISREFVKEKIALKDLSGEIRKQQWHETRDFLKEKKQHFIFGSGLANYQNKIKPYHQEGIFFNRDHDPDFRRKLIIFNEEYKSKYWQPVEIYLYPHNIFLNFWTELGLFGMILFIWIIGKFFYKGIKLVTNKELEIQSDKIIVLGLVSAMLVIVVHGLVDVPYFKNDLAVLFWVIIAILGIIDTKIKIEKKNKYIQCLN